MPNETLVENIGRAEHTPTRHGNDEIWETSLSDRLRAALRLPSGARFYKCALQINPFGYLQRHARSGAFKSEVEYNNAIIDACRESGIEVIAVTDHYRVQESIALIKAAREA